VCSNIKCGEIITSDSVPINTLVPSKIVKVPLTLTGPLNVTSTFELTWKIVPKPTIERNPEKTLLLCVTVAVPWVRETVPLKSAEDANTNDAPDALIVIWFAFEAVVLKVTDEFAVMVPDPAIPIPIVSGAVAMICPALAIMLKPTPPSMSAEEAVIVLPDAIMSVLAEVRDRDPVICELLAAVIVHPENVVTLPAIVNTMAAIGTTVHATVGLVPIEEL
jgi:hypothetical protein